MLEPGLVQKEMAALQKHFVKKRDYVIKRLRNLGFSIPWVPNATFYIWLNLEGLPSQISDGLNFFQACLQEKVCLRWLGRGTALEYQGLTVRRSSWFQVSSST